MSREIREKSGPSITSFGAAVTKGKMGANGDETISAIVSAWKHYVNASLGNALKEFGMATRASAQMMVSWVGDFTIIQDIFDVIEQLVYGKERDRKREWWRQWRRKVGLSKT
jgi:hypothetical protein